PRLTKAWVNFAAVDAMRRSQPRARFMPAPAAAPFTAAMMGWGASRMARRPSEGEVRAPAGRRAVHRGDDGLGRLAHGEERPVAARSDLLEDRPLALTRLRLAHGLDVAARAEALARSRHHHHAHLGIGAGPGHRVVKILAERAAEGIETLGTVEGEGRDTVLHFVEQAFVGHGRASVSERRTSCRALLPTAGTVSPPPTCGPSPWSARRWADS